MIYERIELNDEAYMITYILDDPITMDNNSKAPKKRPFVVICPGGGYEFVSAREGEPIASAFNAAGINAAVVTYHLKSKFPTALKDLSDAVCIVRENAEKWNVDENKIVVCGFSAGGHLAGSLGVFWNSEPGIKREDKKNKPNGMILAYPHYTRLPLLKRQIRHKYGLQVHLSTLALHSLPVPTTLYTISYYYTNYHTIHNNINTQHTHDNICIYDVIRFT